MAEKKCGQVRDLCTNNEEWRNNERCFVLLYKKEGKRG